MSTEWPDKIYLQWEGTDDYVDPCSPPPSDNDVTWCRDQINRSDVAYVRMNFMRDQLAKKEKLIRHMKHTIAKYQREARGLTKT